MHTTRNPDLIPKPLTQNTVNPKPKPQALREVYQVETFQPETAKPA